MVDVPIERFEELVAEALDGIPDELARRMENVTVRVRDDPPSPHLLGLYEGIPLTNRENYGGMVMPDRITVYRRSICSMCRNEDEVRHQVLVTVLHEVGHHFGISDARLHELGWG